MNQKGICALIFRVHILVMSIFSKTMGWGVGSWPSIPLLVADIYMYVFNQRMVFV